MAGIKGVENGLSNLKLEGELMFDRYEGDILNGYRHGNGLFVFADGSYYSGQWRYNKPSGLGLFHYTDEKFDTGVYEVNSF